MSKIGKKNIVIPKESSIKIEGPNLTITGPKGTKKLTINDKIFSSRLKENAFEIQPLEKKIDKKTGFLLMKLYTFLVIISCFIFPLFFAVLIFRLLTYLSAVIVACACLLYTSDAADE